MKKQSYSNHRRYHYLYHGVLLVLVIFAVTGSFINLSNQMEREADLLPPVLLFTMSVIFALMFYFIRHFGKRLQDRIIRAEENNRHWMLTGKPLDGRLRMSQVVALRFSPDDEFIALAREAAEKQLTNDEIKKAINRWRGDYYRI